MGDLGLALEEAYFSIYQVYLADGEVFLNIGNALEPNEFKGARGVFYFGHQAFSSFFTDNAEAFQHAGNLNEIGMRCNVAYQVHFGFIDVAIGNKLKQVFKCVNSQLFFEQVGPLRPYTLQILNGIG